MEEVFDGYQYFRQEIPAYTELGTLCLCIEQEFYDRRHHPGAGNWEEHTVTVSLQSPCNVLSHVEVSSMEAAVNFRQEYILRAIRGFYDDEVHNALRQRALEAPRGTV